MQTTESTKPFAVITGASSGIGYELAKQFAQNGYDLLVCAENDEIKDAAQQLAGLGAHVWSVQADLSTDEGPERLYDEVRATGRPLDAIALNAGVGLAGDFSRETNLADELKMIHLNVCSTVHLAKKAARDMAARGKGRILITSSIAGMMPTPLEAVYGATKAFDLSFAASLRHELKDTGVSVTALEPGPTDTNFFARAGMQDTKVAEESKKNSAADVARQGFEALIAGKDRVVAATSMGTKLQGAAARFMPESAKAEMHRKQAEPCSAEKTK
jgi:short-subunit dehydrogenase